MDASNKNKKNEKLQEAEKYVDLSHFTQRPTGRDMDFSPDLFDISQTGLPVLSEKSLGKMRFDTPHLHKHNKAESFLVSVFPLLIQNGFRDLFAQKFPEYATEGKGTVFFQGHTHPDNVFFSRLSSLSSLNQYPDILITQDINSLFHKNGRVLNDRNFETFNPVFNDCYAGSGMAHPQKFIRFLASDVLVWVVDKRCWGDKALPREWYELLSPQLENALVCCGDTDFHNQTMYLHFVRDFGLEAVRQLARNTLCRMHPSEMLLSLEANNRLGATIYVMPYSWARLLSTHPDYSIVWPEDGAIALPVHLLLKKGLQDKYREIIRFLTGREMGEFFRDNGFISTNPRVMHPAAGRRINWLGWDFICNTDLDTLKNAIYEIVAE